MFSSTQMQALGDALYKARTNYEIKKSLKSTIENDLAEKQIELQAQIEYSDVLRQTNILLQKTSDYQRRQSCKQIESIGTSALQFIMGPDFRLEVDLKDIRRGDDEKKAFQTDTRRRPEAEIYIVNIENGQEIRNRPQDSRGGGVVDIVSMALRIAMIEAVDPPINGPIILDEPGKHVSEDFIVAFSEFIKAISRQLDRQIIMVTHSYYMAQSADKRIEIKIENGVSKIATTKNGG